MWNWNRGCLWKFYENKSLLHFSDYPEDSKFFDQVNKKVIDKMKDEFQRKIISEFFRLKSKMFSRVAIDNEEIKKAKRVNEILLKG